MSAPVVPVSFTLFYRADYYANEITIVAGDATHTGFKLYRYHETYGWVEVGDIPTSEASITDYRGNESDSLVPWRVTAYNADGESPFLQYDPPPPDALSDFTASRASGDPETVTLHWTWQGSTKTLQAYHATAYDASINFWTSLGPVTSTAETATFQISPFADYEIALFDGEYSDGVKLAQTTLPVEPLAQREAPVLIAASVAVNGRVSIRFSPVAWEAEAEFLYRLAFTGPGEPQVLTRTAGVLHEGETRHFFDTVSGITHGNAAGWSVVLQGVSALGEGETSAPAALTAEDVAQLLSLTMNATGQVNWVFSDWENAVPLDVETRIDGGPWRHTLTTDPGRSSDETYGDACIFGNDWSGGLLGIVHYHFPFDAAPHQVQARGRAHGTTEWFETPEQTIPLRSYYHPELIWSQREFVGAAGMVLIPEPTLFVQRPPSIDGYQLRLAVDGAPFRPFHAFNPPTTHRQGVTFTDLPVWLEEAEKDGQAHLIHLEWSALREGQPPFVYPFPPVEVVIPPRVALAPSPPVFTGGDTQVLGTVVRGRARAAHPIPLEFAVELRLNGAPVPFTILETHPWLEPNTLRYEIDATAVPPGLTHLLHGSMTVTNARTGETSAPGPLPDLTFRLPSVPPSRPQFATAQLLRQNAGGIPDLVKLTWSGGQLVQLIAAVDGKSVILGYADSTEDSMLLENTARLLEKTGALISVRFGVRGYQRLVGVGDAVLSAPLAINAPAPPDAPEGPALMYSAFLQQMAADFNQSEIMVDLLYRTAFARIRALVAKGGAVSLQHFGRFAADWTKGHRRPLFTFDPAFKLGVQQGIVLP